MEIGKMAEINVLSLGINSKAYNYNSASQLLAQSSFNHIVVAQTVKDPDLLGNVEHSFNHFVQTGQVWALLIGLILGYVIRSMTSYG